MIWLRSLLTTILLICSITLIVNIRQRSHSKHIPSPFKKKQLLAPKLHTQREYPINKVVDKVPEKDPIPSKCRDMSDGYAASTLIIGNDGEDFKYTNKSSRLLVTANYKYSEKSRRIIEHDVSDQGIPRRFVFFSYTPLRLNPSYLCSIESAALHNPEWEIMLFVPDITEFKAGNTWIEGINFGDRLVIKELEYDKYFTQTPLDTWYTSGKYLNSKWVLQNLGNAFRLAVLWKIGGVYLDMDIITLNPFGGRVAGRTVAREDSTRVNNAVLSFPHSDPFLWSVMEVFVNNFQGYTWAHNGPLAVTRAYLRDCAGAKLEEMASRYNVMLGEKRHYKSHCRALNVAKRERFYPIHYSMSKILVEPWYRHCDVLRHIYSKSVGIHWWNSMLKATKRNMGINEESLISKIMSDHCPISSLNIWSE